MGEKHNPKRPPAFVLAPVPIEDPRKRPTVRQPPWWTLCAAWLQYHSIQIRWHIERWLARHLHRRWGS